MFGEEEPLIKWEDPSNSTVETHYLYMRKGYGGSHKFHYCKLSTVKKAKRI